MGDGDRRSECPINVALEILGDRWTLLIVRDLIFSGKTYYGSFLESAEKISTNILADRLKKLECAGILHKEVDETHRSRFRYRLTEKGLDLVPIVLDLLAWSAKHEDAPARAVEFAGRLAADRDGVIAEIRERLHSSGLTV